MKCFWTPPDKNFSAPNVEFYFRSRHVDKIIIVKKNMKKLFIIIIVLGLTTMVGAQTIPWVSKQYAIKDSTVNYLTAVDYRNLNVTMSMDISRPTNDPPRSCGRPLMILIHGGAFIGGSRNADDLVVIRQDFAKRGYVVASIDYRLGMISTYNSYGCALATLAGVSWDCLNQTDSLEWYRALHRGIQDAHAAIRYFMNNNQPYRVDPNNVFVVGESAGAFIALGTGFIDVASEQLPGTGARPAAPQPNSIYIGRCTGTIANMNTARPDLGSYLGTGNWPSQRPYTIRGVGDLYGACFKNPFLQNADNAKIPSLYIFHQVGDRIVSHNSYWVAGRAAYCLVNSGICPTYLINTPMSHGGTTIKNWINTLAANGQPRPVMQAEILNNPGDCSQYFSAPDEHFMDNYTLRTGNMATFFSSKIVGCTNKVMQSASTTLQSVTVYPNPSTGTFQIQLESGNSLIQLKVYDLVGKLVCVASAAGQTQELTLPPMLTPGTYILEASTNLGQVTRRIILE
jgi:Secretion system C-terminal sorting domain/Carboxylesterase family/alpha/beta hydrolase fold